MAQGERLMDCRIRVYILNIIPNYIFRVTNDNNRDHYKRQILLIFP